jgi:hypothetical protein
MTNASERLETKTPPEQSAREGFERFELLKWDQPISPPRESARASTSPKAIGLSAISVGWMNVFALLIVLSRSSRVTSAREGAGV